MNSLLITGANRGIGLQLVKHYCQKQWQIYATYRDEHQDLLEYTKQYDNLILLKLDVSCIDSINKLKRSMTGIGLQLLINNAGIHGDRSHRFGSTEQQNIDKWHETFTINTIAPMLITEALLENLHAGAQSSKTLGAKVAFITSKMGSIADNSSGGSYVYRSSKSALNSVVKSLSHDIKTDNISVAAIHPGWVKTRMGGPNGLIDVETSVAGISQVIEQMNQQNSGQFVNYDGSTIPW